jgi:hypothetical protein
MIISLPTLPGFGTSLLLFLDVPSIIGGRGK